MAHRQLGAGRSGAARAFSSRAASRAAPVGSWTVSAGLFAAGAQTMGDYELRTHRAADPELVSLCLRDKRRLPFRGREIARAAAASGGRSACAGLALYPGHDFGVSV